MEFPPIIKTVSNKKKEFEYWVGDTRHTCTSFGGDWPYCFPLNYHLGPTSFYIAWAIFKGIFRCDQEMLKNFLNRFVIKYSMYATEYHLTFKMGDDLPKFWVSKPDRSTFDTSQLKLDEKYNIIISEFGNKILKGREIYDFLGNLGFAPNGQLAIERECQVVDTTIFFGKNKKFYIKVEEFQECMKVIESNAQILFQDFMYIKATLSEDGDNLVFNFPSNVIYMSQLLVVMVAFGARVDNTTKEFNDAIKKMENETNEFCYEENS